MKIICAGSRHFDDYQLLEDKLSNFINTNAYTEYEYVEIVSGGATGADTLGEQYAQEHDLECTIFAADWNQHGKSAGPIRNKEMAEYAEAAIVFWDGNKTHSGSYNMINTAFKLGLIVEIVYI